MSQITQKTPIPEIGAIVCEALKKAGLDAFLSGGAVVSIYTNNRYESFDLDFVSLSDRSKIKRVMESLDFVQDAGRHFVHPNSKFYVEFPDSAVLVGESPITEFNELQVSGNILKLLTPTDCVKDRLATFYHWNDRQGLDQAVWVSERRASVRSTMAAFRTIPSRGSSCCAYRSLNFLFGTKARPRPLARLTMYFAEQVAYKQQHEMLSLGVLSRQLNAR